MWFWKQVESCWRKFSKFPISMMQISNFKRVYFNKRKWAKPDHLSTQAPSHTHMRSWRVGYIKTVFMNKLGVMFFVLVTAIHTYLTNRAITQKVTLCVSPLLFLPYTKYITPGPASVFHLTGCYTRMHALCAKERAWNWTWTWTSLNITIKKLCIT